MKDKIIKEDKTPSKIRLKKLNITNEEKEDMNESISNNNNNNVNKEMIDENYVCPSCKEEMISEYCINCNLFKCNTCIENCKDEQHEHLKIDLDGNCIKEITTFGEQVTSNIDKNLEEILDFNKELQIYDIKNFRDNLITLINEIYNLYNEITSILKNLYKEKGVKKEMNKYEAESNKIKAEVNEILHKANSYLKNDEDISTPKYKIMNMQYFFNIINEKGKTYNSLTNKMKKYSLNLTINSNIEKSFNDIKNIMTSMINKENPFFLKDDLKREYQKLIQSDLNPKLEKRNLFNKRKTLSIKPIRLPHFPSIVGTKNFNLDLNDSDVLDS